MGAWIETKNMPEVITKKYVAPYVGAWIETSCCLSAGRKILVAPYVGAWIETSYSPIGTVHS